MLVNQTIFKISGGIAGPSNIGICGLVLVSGQTLDHNSYYPKQSGSFIKQSSRYKKRISEPSNIDWPQSFCFK